EPGIAKVEQLMGVENLYDELSQNLVHQLQVALKAKELYKRDKVYIVTDGEVKIVDEFTGRILEGRRWSEGIHQAVEAKEGVRIKEENQTLATITLQNYFRLYDKLAGMTGTAVTEAAEFASTYELAVVPIPTHRAVARLDQGDLIYKTEAAKFESVVADLAERYEAGQPVLVGTVSVEKSELLASLLRKQGIPHEVLNAKQHTREAEIVAQAGRLHSVTVATNMAGRGVDIILGGNAEGLATRELQAEGLARGTDEGEARYKALVERFEPETRAEGDKVRDLGGLYVLGTERHESRRIDNQLRGRSGRQGDPGESRFYLSLEDELMRLFATGAMSWVMGKALPDDVPIEAKEGVRIKEENQTLATVTLQNYFRLYEKLAGMTGTAETEASELASTYTLQVVPIPTNKPMIRIDAADLIYRGEDAKYEAVVEDLVERHETGQPVLVGTVSVEKSEKLSRLLEKRGIEHEVLNAKQHTREAIIVTQAGRLGSITVATNMAGRGVDILLGGNPEGLAARDVVAEGLDPESDEGKARYEVLLRKHEVECQAEGDKVRELGGLYVLGTERHESRRIDNQLRGRSGRQGDPGESRFYLSLEDELMRIFATGAMSWVMTKALPDDVPIEARMVTKAIERAQNTVEQRNAEIRKNVLKYDEVMNEQRKVIYKRRDQILQGADLREEAIEYLADAVESTISTYCVSDYSEEWDVEGLVNDIAQFWPSQITASMMTEQCSSTDELYQLLMGEATGYYEQREQELGAETLREVERQVMLRIIDQKWREHLYEMDYLQEGIHLRAMGQKDPLVEWQREGYDMFGQMMHGIAQDFVKYVMHAQVSVQAEGQTEQAAVSNVSYSAPEDPSTASSTLREAARAQALGEGAPPEAVKPEEPVVNTPIVKSEWDKTSRNAPCPCGSGKKYKMCHGR
ncbi:MAG: preprotein translocase subunit SecA, partial [Acidimicrobiaceae bacterium]